MNFGVIIAIAIIGLWALGIFMGALGGITKKFTTPPPSSIDSSSTRSQEQQIIDDTAAKQQKLMDDMKQKIEDAGHNY